MKTFLRVSEATRDGKASGAGWWAVFTLVFYCKVSQTAFFVKY